VQFLNCDVCLDRRRSCRSPKKTNDDYENHYFCFYAVPVSNVALVPKSVDQTQPQNDVSTFQSGLDLAIKQFRDQFTRRLAVASDVETILEKASPINQTTRTIQRAALPRLSELSSAPSPAVERSSNWRNHCAAGGLARFLFGQRQPRASDEYGTHDSIEWAKVKISQAH